MEAEDLPDPQDLWWSWVALAVLHRSTGDKACGFDPERRVLHLDAADGSWLRLQQVLGTRTTLWGRSTLAAETADASRDAPDWALTDALLDRTPAFLAWHAHDEWDASLPWEDEGAIPLLRPVLTVDPRVVEALRSPDLEPEWLRRWTDGPHLEDAVDLLHDVTGTEPRGNGGAVRTRLRDQIHEQMRVAEDRDRMLIQRPPVLVQWSRVNGPRLPFEYAAMAVRGELRPAPTNTHLAPLAVRTLTNVLAALYRDEASEESGAWLFARAWSDGVLISFDRAFDSWPSWYQVRHASQGPSLDDLAWEMAQRTPAWRPTWSSLLPAEPT